MAGAARHGPPSGLGRRGSGAVGDVEAMQCECETSSSKRGLEEVEQDLIVHSPPPRVQQDARQPHRGCRPHGWAHPRVQSAREHRYAAHLIRLQDRAAGPIQVKATAGRA
eukprot:scaffold713_cov114-Isochrysis_galbana.AAC.5